MVRCMCRHYLLDNPSSQYKLKENKTFVSVLFYLFLKAGFFLLNSETEYAEVCYNKVIWPTPLKIQICTMCTPKLEVGSDNFNKLEKCLTSCFIKMNMKKDLSMR